MVVMESTPDDEEVVATATVDIDGGVTVTVELSQDVVVNVDNDDDCVVVGDCEVVTAAGVVCKIGNKSLLFNGSRADCEDKLNTELQLIDRLLSSSLL